MSVELSLYYIDRVPCIRVDLDCNAKRWRYVHVSINSAEFHQSQYEIFG